MMPHQTHWLGREEAFPALDMAIRRTLRAPVDVNVMKMYSGDDEEDDRNPVRMEQVGNLTILHISGPMMNRSSWITRYLGIVTYEDIRAQMMKVIDDEDTSAILLNINSPGGYADGCFSLGRFIRAYNDNIKNVVSFTDGQACSGGYALMAATSKMMMSEDAMVGSIGVIAIHEELTEMFKEIGIKHEVFRSAPNKALGQPVEKLTDKARASIQKDVMHLHNNFVRYLSSMLGMDADAINQSIATGETFTFREAKKNKMIHNVMTFEEAVGKLATALEKPKPKGFLQQQK